MNRREILDEMVALANRIFEIVSEMENRKKAMMDEFDGF